MTTLFVGIRRRPGLSREDFVRHWRDVHAPLIATCPEFARHLTRYVQHLPTDPGAAAFGVSADFDGLAELGFVSREAMAVAFNEPAYVQRVHPDEANFVDLESCVSYVGEPYVVVGGATELFSVRGKTAVVTGGAKGVGAMIAGALIDAGAGVLVVARGGDASRAFCSDLAQRGSCELLEYDLATREGLDGAAHAIAARTGRLDILVNNAGTFTAAPLEQLSLEQWDREQAINLRAPFFLVQKLLPLLEAAASESDPARIVNIGSIAALWAKSSSAYAYSASKGGLHQLTRALAADLTARHITVNAIAPGFFPSDMTDGFFDAVPGLKEQMIAGIPAHRLGTAPDIGGAVIFLASRAGAYLSGAVLPVEGGLWSA